VYSKRITHVETSMMRKVLMKGKKVKRDIMFKVLMKGDNDAMLKPLMKVKRVHNDLTH